MFDHMEKQLIQEVEWYHPDIVEICCCSLWLDSVLFWCYSGGAMPGRIGTHSTLVECFCEQENYHCKCCFCPCAQQHDYFLFIFLSLSLLKKMKGGFLTVQLWKQIYLDLWKLLSVIDSVIQNYNVIILTTKLHYVQLLFFLSSCFSVIAVFCLSKKSILDKFIWRNQVS